jgi:AcrR family transcriptional regulator
MSELSPRQRRRQRTRQAILDAARHIINRQGVDALSMRKIAERIDYSPAGLYEYFGSKEAIVEAVVMEGHRRLAVRLQQVDTGLPPDTYLVELGMAYVDFATGNPDYYLVMFTTVLQEANLEAMMSKESAFPILLQGIQNGIDTGVLAADPEQEKMGIAHAVWSLVHGIAMLRITYLRGFPLDFAVADRAAMAALVDGLGSP